MLHLIYLLIVFKVDSVFPKTDVNDLKLDYYEKLMTTLTAETSAAELPKSNKDFKKGFESSKTQDYGEFDFIIVGAGSTGAVVANRLSEIAEWKILLIEAGLTESDFSVIPANSLNLQFSRFNWGYLTKPQNNSCLGMKNKQCSAARGKTLGGTSAINVMMYVRGNPQDYDKWEQMGNKGWSYADVLPYFLKSENSQIDGADAGYHAYGGMLNVEFTRPLHPMVQAFFEASTQLGYPKLDYNGKNQLGCSATQFTIKNGFRHSTRAAFLDNADFRKNLNVTKGALVSKILFDNSNKKAIGVEFIMDDKKYRAQAKKEVIVSGGVFNSPQLLMLSGIGPKNDLEKLGIDVVADLPVGVSLMEHPVFHGMKFRTNVKGGDRTGMRQMLADLLNNKNGSLTIPTNVQAISFSTSSYAEPKTRPDLEYMFYPFNITNPFYNRAFNFDDNIVKKYLNKLDQLRDIQIMPILLHEKSRGSVKLQSKSPIDFPLIDFNMFSDKNNEDIKVMIEAIKFILRLIETKPFKDAQAEFIDWPICDDEEKYSDDYWECMLRHVTSTIYHPAGTAQMGKQGDPESVVDNNLKVHGFDNLRVADASVLPSTVSGHLNAICIMIGEKISDVIKSDYGKSTTGCILKKL